MFDEILERLQEVVSFTKRCKDQIDITTSLVPTTDLSLLEEIGDGRFFETHELPLCLQREVELVIPDDYGIHEEDVDFVWKKEYMSVFDLLSFLGEDFDLDYFDVQIFDDCYDLEGLMLSIKKEGMKTPVVIGPTGLFEGYHRLLAAYKLGLERIPVLRAYKNVK